MRPKLADMHTLSLPNEGSGMVKLRRGGVSSSWAGKVLQDLSFEGAADTQQQQHLYNVQMWQRCACPENWFGVHSTEFFQSKDILIFPVSFHHLSKHLRFNQIKTVKSLHLPFHDSPLPIYDSPANVQSSQPMGRQLFILTRLLEVQILVCTSVTGPSYFCIYYVAGSFNPAQSNRGL